MNAHEIDYVIRGNEMQDVEIERDPSESAVAEAGSMMMDAGIAMETVFGDGSGGTLCERTLGPGELIRTEG